MFTKIPQLCTEHGSDFLSLYNLVMATVLGVVLVHVTVCTPEMTSTSEITEIIYTIARIVKLTMLTIAPL